MIILFTANINGGILQFVIQTAVSLFSLNHSFFVYLPEDARVTIPDRIKPFIKTYKRTKTINTYHKNNIELSKRILKDKPDFIWYCDSIIQSSQILLNIGDKTSQILTLHDAGDRHPQNGVTIKRLMHNKYEDYMLAKAEKAAKYLLLLSKSVLNSFTKKNQNYKNKCMMMNLGAHVPEADDVKPIEIDHDIKEYILFFGRIDKYKGITRLLNIYNTHSDISMPLILAGNGKLSEEEKLIIQKNNDRIILINRYIEDGEMLYLFKNTSAVVLPYLQATQSGVIPISYKYGKPVIVSNIDGLVQFVDENKTGYKFDTDQEFVSAIKRIESGVMKDEFYSNCDDYYNRNFNWLYNVQKLLSQLIEC